MSESVLSSCVHPFDLVFCNAYFFVMKELSCFFICWIDCFFSPFSLLTYIAFWSGLLWQSLMMYISSVVCNDLCIHCFIAGDVISLWVNRLEFIIWHFNSLYRIADLVPIQGRSRDGRRGDKLDPIKIELKWPNFVPYSSQSITTEEQELRSAKHSSRFGH